MKEKHWYKFLVLFCLYIAQSVPMSFFSTVVPVIMRQNEYSLASIGMLQMVKLPWIFKFLWAPIVDKTSINTRGFKKWIFFSEFFYAVIILTVSFFQIETDFKLIVILLVIAFTASATQDIATDAFAIINLKPKERSFGNSMQSSGSFAGTIIGTGVLLIAYHYFGWSVLLLCLAGFVLIALIPLLFFNKKTEKIHTKKRITPIEVVMILTTLAALIALYFVFKKWGLVIILGGFGLIALSSIFRKLTISENVKVFLAKGNFTDILSFFRKPGSLKHYLFLAFYYSGIVGILAMLKPFMIDYKYNVKEIGFISGIIGTSTAALSALLAGYIIKITNRKTAAILFACISLISALYFLLFLSNEVSYVNMYIGVCLVWCSYGLSSVVVYTIAMDRVRKNLEGTDFTIQIVITHLSSLLIVIFSGKIGDKFGYEGLFSFEVIMCFISLLIVITLLPKTVLQNESK